jgi:hypothetical protein
MPSRYSLAWGLKPEVYYFTIKTNIKMKVFKTMMALLTALIISFSGFSQAAPATTAKPASTQTTTTARPNSDARTKTGDKINKDLKGPNGETVYTGPKGGNYYLNKSGNKTYLKSSNSSTPAK